MSFQILGFAFDNVNRLNSNFFSQKCLWNKTKISIIIYNVFNWNIWKGLSLMDTRLIVIAAPLLVAASWALFNIGRLAIQQIQRFKR